MRYTRSMPNGPPDRPAAPAQQFSAESSMANNWRWRLLLIGTMALAAVVRLIGLNSKSVFADELGSLNFVHQDWAGLWHLIKTSEANMALYYVLLRLWVGLSGSVWFARLLSVVFGVVTAPVLYLLGRRLFSRTAAILACLLLTLNSFHIEYSQAARGYSLAVLLVTLSSLCFVQMLHRRGTPQAYIAASAAALYSHFFSGFVILAQGLSLFFPSVKRSAVLRQVWLMLMVAVLASPLLLFAAIHKTAPIFWVQKPTSKDIYHLLTYLTGSGLKFGIALIALTRAAWEWYSRVRSSPSHNGQDETWSFEFTALWLLLPIALALAISFWKPVFSPRFLMICLPPLTLLIGAGLSAIRPKWLTYSVSTVLIVSCLTALPAYYRSPGIEDWKGAEAFLRRSIIPSDLVVVDPSYQDVYKYSFLSAGHDPPTPNLSSTVTTADLESAPANIWIISCHPTHTAQDKLPPLPFGYVAGPIKRFIGIEVLHYVRQTPP